MGEDRAEVQELRELFTAVTMRGEKPERAIGGRDRIYYDVEAWEELILPIEGYTVVHAEQMIVPTGDREVMVKRLKAGLKACEEAGISEDETCRRVVDMVLGAAGLKAPIDYIEGDFAGRLVTTQDGAVAIEQNLGDPRQREYRFRTVGIATFNLPDSNMITEFKRWTEERAKSQEGSNGGAK